MAKTINLDAMIVREDFAAEEANLTSNVLNTIGMNDLKGNLLSSVIRKPDFQRETHDWSPQNVLKFIDSIVNGQFIPSLILWKNSSGYIFVIDGAHRLSSLIAWMNDDYGDGPISRRFFQNNISEEQKKAAEILRKQIKKEIGVYADYDKAPEMPDAYSVEFVNKSRRLKSFAFSIQWITGNVETAEESFYNINQRAVPINDTEFKLIKSRKNDSCIAARAIMYSGSGNKYWKGFAPEQQHTIVALSTDINKLLFEPRYDKPIKTLDLPMCGKNQSNLTFIFDMINIITDKESTVDKDGALTIQILSDLKHMLEIISSKEPESLGLHPVVYFYSRKGNFKVSAFYAILCFVKYLKDNKKFNDFIEIRGKFEGFIYQYDYVIDQINRYQRSTKKSIPLLKLFYIDVMKYLCEGLEFHDVIDKIIQSERYPKFLLEQSDDDVSTSGFNSNRKSEIFIGQAFPNALKCPICKGLLHVNSISIDHKVRIQDGGCGNATNGQAAHFYCNTTYKN